MSTVQKRVSESSFVVIMSIHFPITVSDAGLLRSASDHAAVAERVGFEPTLSAVPLQTSGGAHLAALLGLLLLTALGTILVARDRLQNRRADSYGDTTEHDYDHDSEHGPDYNRRHKHNPNYDSRRDEFMTDQERVHKLIRENGGRMKQSRIVDSVDWSKAKVSRLLAELEEDDQVTKLRLGRENLVCLPGHEPTASKSPEQSNE